MLAEIAAANAAFAIIKKCVENGSDIAKAGKAISDFTLNKDAAQRKVTVKHGSNLDGSKSDLEDADEENENIAYTRYVLELGYSGDFLDLLSSLAPCVLGYGEIGLNNINTKPNISMYQKWLETYASVEYQDVCKNVGKLIDDAFLLRLGNNFVNTYKWKKVNAIFKKATLLEVDFWNMALK